MRGAMTLPLWHPGGGVAQGGPPHGLRNARLRRTPGLSRQRRHDAPGSPLSRNVADQVALVSSHVSPEQEDGSRDSA